MLNHHLGNVMRLPNTSRFSIGFLFVITTVAACASLLAAGLASHAKAGFDRVVVFIPFVAAAPLLLLSAVALVVWIADRMGRRPKP